MESPPQQEHARVSFAIQHHSRDVMRSCEYPVFSLVCEVKHDRRSSQMDRASALGTSGIYMGALAYRASSLLDAREIKKARPSTSRCRVVLGLASGYRSVSQIVELSLSKILSSLLVAAVSVRR